MTRSFQCLCRSYTTWYILQLRLNFNFLKFDCGGFKFTCCVKIFSTNYLTKWYGLQFFCLYHVTDGTCDDWQVDWQNNTSLEKFDSANEESKYLTRHLSKNMWEGLMCIWDTHLTNKENMAISFASCFCNPENCKYILGFPNPILLGRYFQT